MLSLIFVQVGVGPVFFFPKLHIALISINHCDASRHIDHRHFELKHRRPQPGSTRHAYSSSANIYSHLFVLVVTSGAL